MPATDEPAVRFESLLASLIEAHEQMVAVALDHRAAIARADAAGVQSCIGRQTQLLTRVAALETERQALTSAIAPVRPGSPAATISLVAQALPEPARGRILGAATKLRDVLLRLQHENKVLRSATQMLMSHMDGLIQQVTWALSRARLYGPRGRIDAGGPAPCGFDLTH